MGAQRTNVEAGVEFAERAAEAVRHLGSDEMVARSAAHLVDAGDVIATIQATDRAFASEGYGQGVRVE